MAQNALSPAQWRQDLAYLAAQIPKVHPEAFHHVSQATFDAAVADLDTQIPTLSDHDAELALTRLVALLGEGHSRISLPGLPDPMSDVPELTPVKEPRLAFHRAPVRFFAFSDGLYIVAATPEYRSLIGARVTRIGDRSSEDALIAVRPLINRDNETGVRLIGPDLVVVPEVLQALQVTPDASQIPITVREVSGETVSLLLPALATSAEPAWVDAYDGSSVKRPLDLRQPGRNLWAQYVPEQGTVFVRINVLQNQGGETVAKFAHELDDLIDARRPDRVVIDLRDCHGGDNQLFRSLLLALVRNSLANQPGKLFVVTGRATFSAAVNAASDLERLTNAIFVGEPTAGAPSSWGDPKPVVLPNSGLKARISTVYWRDWTADETRPSITPDLAAPPSSADYLAGADPAMRTILSLPKQPGFGDLLAALAHKGVGAVSILRLYYQHKTDALWADSSTEKAMQQAAEQYLSAKSYKDALLMFRINQRDYPGSLAAALAAVGRARLADPGDKGLQDLGDKLNALKTPA
jgi:hypothetical protein